jgi:hypothetical protein
VLLPGAYAHSLTVGPGGVESLDFYYPQLVPEPSSWLLLALGGIGLAIASLCARRRSPA